MFSKLKHLKELRDHAKTLQKALAEEKVTIEKSGVKIVMDGNMEVSSITLNDGLAKESLEGILADCVNEAIKKTQRLMAQKMQSMGGMPKF